MDPKHYTKGDRVELMPGTPDARAATVIQVKRVTIRVRDDRGVEYQLCPESHLVRRLEVCGAA